MEAFAFEFPSIFGLHAPAAEQLRPGLARTQHEPNLSRPWFVAARVARVRRSQHAGTFPEADCFPHAHTHALLARSSSAQANLAKWPRVGWVFQPSCYRVPCRLRFAPLGDRFSRELARWKTLRRTMLASKTKPKHCKRQGFACAWWNASVQLRTFFTWLLFWLVCESIIYYLIR